MKLHLSFLLAALGSFASADDADRNCITGEVDPTKDYFPVKSFPEESKLWTISYHNTYKIVKNLATNSSFLLYQCGSEPPVDQLAAHTDFIEIPVRNVGVGQTVSIPYLDTLGQLEEIAIFMTDVQYVSSPCFLDRIKAEQVLVAADTEGQTELVNQAQQDGNQDLLELLQGMVAFVGPFSDTPFQHPVEVSEYLEKTNGAIYEWLKFYAAFFNEEEIANEAVAAASDRYQCVTENAARVEADFPEKPLVLWGSYSSYCGGWNYATCPNFYCEIANACSVDILSDEPEAGSLELCDGYIFKTLEEFIEFGKDADYWFYDNNNWNETAVEFGEELSQIKAFRDKQVFDYQGAGLNKWYGCLVRFQSVVALYWTSHSFMHLRRYEERFGSYYDLLQDFCGIVGTTSELQGQGWFRNVFTEPIGDGGTCTEDGGHSLLPYNFECEPSEFDPVQAGSNSGSSFLISSSLVVTVSFWLVAMLVL